MRREAMWSAWDAPGLEHLRLVMHNNGVVADGTAMGATEGRPFSVVYEVRCDVGWRVRAVRLGVAGPSRRVSICSQTAKATGRRLADGPWQN